MVAHICNPSTQEVKGTTGPELWDPDTKYKHTYIKKDKNLNVLRYISVHDFSGVSTSQDTRRQTSQFPYLSAWETEAGVLQLEVSPDYISHNSTVRPCLRTFSDDGVLRL